MEQILLFSRGPYIWNNFISPEKKQFTTIHKYKAVTKLTLILLAWNDHTTGITCKKIPCYMRDSACRWLVVENAKLFRSYVKYF